jgi:hypothetical protein
VAPSPQVTSPSGAPDPSTAAATTAASATATRPSAVTRTPTTTTCVPTAAVPCPDGRPGWSGTDACSVWETGFATAGREVLPGLTASLALPAGVGSTSFTAELTLTNSTAADLEVRVASANLGLLLLQGGEVDAAYGDSRTVAVAAGASSSLAFQGSTRSCGDTPATGRVRIPAGSHGAGALLRLTVDELTAPSEAPTPSQTPLVGGGSTRNRLITDQEVSLGGTVTVR